MRFYILALMAALTSVSALRHSPTDADGLYSHTKEADGSITTHYLGLAGDQNPKFVRRSSPEDETSTAGLGKRDTGAHCNSPSLNGSPSDFLGAEGGLAVFFGTGQSFVGTQTYKSGNAVAFGCDYGNGQEYTACQLTSDVQAIDALCGQGGAGWSSHESWKSTYGRTLLSESFC